MDQGTIYRVGKKSAFPFFIIAQTGQLFDLNTRVIIPLAKKTHQTIGIGKVNPVIIIGGAEYILLTQLIQTVFTHQLDDDDIYCERPDLRDIIVDAVGFLVTGS